MWVYLFAHIQFANNWKKAYKEHKRNEREETMEVSLQINWIWLWQHGPTKLNTTKTQQRRPHMRTFLLNVHSRGKLSQNKLHTQEFHNGEVCQITRTVNKLLLIIQWNCGSNINTNNGTLHSRARPWYFMLTRWFYWDKEEKSDKGKIRYLSTMLRTTALLFTLWGTEKRLNVC